MLLDVGANAECKPKHLYEFAVMGSLYSSVIVGIRNPRVGILSIGEEEAKGNDLTKEAFKLFKSSPSSTLSAMSKAAKSTRGRPTSLSATALRAMSP